MKEYIKRYKLITTFSFFLVFFSFGLSKVNADCWTVCDCWERTICCDDWVCDGHGGCQQRCYACTLCCGSHVECDCETHACNGCTPSCPSGQSTAISGPLCLTGSSSCTGSNGCDPCTLYGASCYLPETNLSDPDTPTSLTMIVDGEIYSLSTSSSNPTTIKYPSTEGNVVLTLPELPSNPTVYRSLGYIFRANNYGINDEWIAWTDCDSPRDEDFCSESTENIQTFTPSALTTLEVLKESAEGKISGIYYTVNKCDDGRLYSLPLETYYKVDSNPDSDVDVCDWDSTLLASDPECVNPETDEPEENICPMLPDEQCTKEEILPDLADPEKSSSTSTRGCMSETYTGKEVNNALSIRLGATDENSIEEIKGTVVWLSKDDSTQAISEVTDTYTSTNTDDMAVMILQNDGSWNNDPLIYALNNDNTWGLIPDNTLRNSSGDNIARVSNVEISKGETLVTFEFDMEFISNYTDQAGGIYHFNSVVLDEYMILSDGRIDQSHMTRYFDWGIDLEDPTVDNPTQTVLDPQVLNLDLTANDANSQLTDIVLNAYKSGGLTNGSILLENPTVSNPSLTVSENVPSVDLIGHLTGEYSLNTWHFGNIYNQEYNQTFRINIESSEGGAIVLYATAFDQACNSSNAEEKVDLTPWIATKGGIIYSNGALGSYAKDVSEVESLAESIRNILPSELTTGTELISSRNEIINSILYSDTLGSVRAMEIYDSNERENYWFEYFSNKLTEQRDNLTDFTISQTDNSVSQSCSGTNCLMYSTEDIEIPSGYICDKNTLFMSEKDIIINPDITEPSENQSTKGCIFLAKDDIIIKDGERKSTSDTVKYDYIEGFLIANNQIDIPTADSTDAIRDALEIKGGLVAMGSTTTNNSAILINRNLRLYNYSHPTVVVSWEPKYARLSEIFFGTEAPMYKQEVGFKVF